MGGCAGGSRWVIGSAVLSVLLAGCGPHADAVNVGRASSKPTASAEFEPAQVASAGTANTKWAVPGPGPLRGKLVSADILVIGKGTLPARLRKDVAAINGVRTATPLSIASVPVADRSITVAGVDPAVYRRYVPEQAATMEAVWDAVAQGDALVTHAIGKDLDRPLGGTLALRNGKVEMPLRIGGYATTVPHVDAVVNERRRDQLGMTSKNALLVSLNAANRIETTDAIRRAVGKRADVQHLGAAATGTRQAANLTGSAVSAELGSFSYRYFADGTVEPQASWVAANIRTESVPILGRVTCHRVMLPQLRAALTEIVERGLADRIDPGDYGGCYVPRFIGHDFRRGLSLHTWGIAVDVNVAGNQRGTVGEIDREVVAIFKRWGFAWGGDWKWTDPMHFELAAIVRP